MNLFNDYMNYTEMKCINVCPSYIEIFPGDKVVGEFVRKFNFMTLIDISIKN